ncbi:ABC transporter ATP-binding protein [Ornithinimicrobium cerasi]|uniref:ABC transporter ATP-binding protein n=1 Tax=Ornithinimicrobium cerasi TaxID=2248773 RepID=UPI000EFF15E3|nr:ABC transporter ATP-binding protein [Ornithinimicrobium cerasi]
MTTTDRTQRPPDSAGGPARAQEQGGRAHVGPDIWCEDLVRIYSTEGVEVQALQGLNLVVDPGDVVALVGASGSGKSTLLGILSGLDRPTGGRARVAGVDLLTMNRAQRVDYQRHVVGFVWQQTSRNLLPFLTAADNVALPMVISSRTGRGGRVGELLELLGVADCADRRPSQLSGGQQQRVAIATALANSPAVLLADEPTGELDDAASEQVLEAMRTAAGELGTTVLVVTHDPTVSDHVRRTVQIRDGRTSTEVLRQKVVGPDGVERTVAREYTVIDRAGRIQLPKQHVQQLGLHDRVRIEKESTHVQVWPDDQDHHLTDPATGDGEEER